jgi:hypothetical protein
MTLYFFRKGYVIERRVRVVNTPASYYGNFGFQCRPQRPAILIDVFRVFSQSLQASADIVLGHERSLFILINLSPYHRPYIV